MTFEILDILNAMLIISLCIDHSIHIQSGCLGSRLQILLDPVELLHPGHPGGDVIMLTDHPGLHQPHQVYDCVQRDVSVGHSVSTEEALFTQRLNDSTALGFES